MSVNAAAALPMPEIYYDPHGKCYFMQNERGHFIPYSAADTKIELKLLGYSDKVLDGERVSPLERILAEVRRCRDVDYAAPLAGYLAGEAMFEGRRILVTEGPSFIVPMEGSWSTIRAVLEGLLVPDDEPPWGDRYTQLRYFYSWLKCAIDALRRGSRRPGQAVVLAGPPGCGKSFWQYLITLLLGGRSAKPYQFLAGLTQFNSDMFTAEHLMIEDEAADHDHRVRRKLGTSLKGLVVNATQRCHPKNRPGIMLAPFWRLSFTLNDDPEDLMVLPPIEGEGIGDKLMLFRAYKKPMPMQTASPEQWAAFEGLIKAELPAFLWYLRNEFQIPADIRDDRYGVGHWHNPDLLKMMSELSAESKLLELIDAKLFPNTEIPTEYEPWDGRASELELQLTGPNSSTSYEARKLLYFNSACGSYLGRLAARHPERIEKRINDGYTIWTIRPPTRTTA